MFLLNFIVAVNVYASCPEMKTNVYPPWSKEDIAGFMEIKMKCVDMRQQCVIEFFKTVQGDYRGVCSVPVPNKQSSKTYRFTSWFIDLK